MSQYTTLHHLLPYSTTTPYPPHHLRSHPQPLHTNSTALVFNTPPHHTTPIHNSPLYTTFHFITTLPHHRPPHHITPLHHTTLHHLPLHHTTPPHHSTTGVISTRRPLDRESTSSFSFYVTATNNCPLYTDHQTSKNTKTQKAKPRSAFSQVIVYVNDINDNTPTLPNSHDIVSIPCHLTSSLTFGSTLFRLEGLDKDEGDNGVIRYWLEGISVLEVEGGEVVEKEIYMHKKPQPHRKIFEIDQVTGVVFATFNNSDLHNDQWIRELQLHPCRNYKVYLSLTDQGGSNNSHKRALTSHHSFIISFNKTSLSLLNKNILNKSTSASSSLSYLYLNNHQTRTTSTYNSSIVIAGVVTLVLLLLFLLVILCALILFSIKWINKKRKKQKMNSTDQSKELHEQARFLPNYCSRSGGYTSSSCGCSTNFETDYKNSKCCCNTHSTPNNNYPSNVYCDNVSCCSSCSNYCRKNCFSPFCNTVNASIHNNAQYNGYGSNNSSFRKHTRHHHHHMNKTNTEKKEKRPKKALSDKVHNIEAKDSNGDATKDETQQTSTSSTTTTTSKTSTIPTTSTKLSTTPSYN